MKKNQYAFCKGHWKIDCPKLKLKESKSETNIAQAHNGNDYDSSGYSLSITHIGCYSEESEWILNTGAIYHVGPNQEWFASFGKLDEDLVSFGDGRTSY